MGVVENLKDAADLAKKLGNIDLYKKIVELEGEVIELTRDKLRLELKVDELQNHFALKAEMSFTEPFYYQEGEETPYCARCFEMLGHAVHVVHKFGDRRSGRWDCPNCKFMYLVE